MHQHPSKVRNRYQKLASLLYIASIQYYLVQFFVASRWSSPFSLSHNTISDLGNTACGMYGTRFVCSPSHTIMNISFVILGSTMVGGSLLLGHMFRKNKTIVMGFGAMTMAGAGTILVGVFPENSIAILHGTGAAFPFLLGNVAMILLSYTLQIPKGLRIYSLLSGSIALVALGFYLTNHYVGLGQGGLERVVAYPQSIWLIVLGFYSLATDSFFHEK